MKKYILKDDARICNSNGVYIISKGTEILCNSYIDEDGGIKGVVDGGEHKGKEVIFNITELDLSIIPKLS